MNVIKLFVVMLATVASVGCNQVFGLDEVAMAVDAKPTPIDAPPPPLSLLSFGLEPTSNLRANHPETTLVFEVENAASCTGTTNHGASVLDWNGPLATTIQGTRLSGRIVVSPIGGLTDYTLVCSGPPGTEDVMATFRVYALELDAPMQAIAGIAFNLHYNAPDDIGSGMYCTGMGGGLTGSYPSPSHTMQMSIAQPQLARLTIACADGAALYQAWVEVVVVPPS
ncbi:MAG: hypothetical protein KBC69_00290 [Candidatus Magasanikbacteria bacterium]|nr:hypothetical protein [Candidatus Magasanikbacteria bacterium]